MAETVYLRSCAACAGHVAFRYEPRQDYAYCPSCTRAAREAFNPQPGDTVAFFEGNPTAGRYVVAERTEDELTIVYRRPGHPDSRPAVYPIGMFDPTMWSRNGFTKWSPRGRR